MKLLKLLALAACFSLVACSHAGPQPGATAMNVHQNPLPDGKYCIPSAPRGIATLDVNAGDKLLLGPGKERMAVKQVGPGPYFRLVDADSDGEHYLANLLALGEDQLWGFASNGRTGVRVSRMQSVPANLHGRWEMLPGSADGDKPISLEFSASTMTVFERGKPEGASLAWLHAGGDDFSLFVAVHDGDALQMMAIEKNGVLALSVLGKGTYLFTRAGAKTESLTLAGLQKQSIVYLNTLGQAFDLKCKDGGCGLQPLDSPQDTLRLKATASSGSEPIMGFSGTGSSGEFKFSLGVVGDRALFVGQNRDCEDGQACNLALSHLPSSKVPSSLVGSWKTSVVFPRQSFDLSEVRIGAAGVETLHASGKAKPAYLVQSAFDSGILLLARTPERNSDAGSAEAAWSLWRLTQSGDGWYLSQWSDGSGLIALRRGAEPADSPTQTMKMALADFCDLGQLKKRVAPFQDAYNLEPRVAIKSFAEDATGHQRFFHVGVRRFFEALMGVDTQQMRLMLSSALAEYNLPRMACPALEDIMARSLDRKKPEPQESEE
ncbi:MAG TPA: hypothetical protein VF518_07960 [Polyangia bacterium]